jgi:hypothetical protein
MKAPPENRAAERRHHLRANVAAPRLDNDSNAIPCAYAQG